MAHAILAPSSASRWLACTPSARLEREFPDIAGDPAEEGTLAHAIGEILLRQHPKKVQALKLKPLKAHKFYDEAMMNHCEDYAGLVLGAMKPGSHLFIEQKLDMTSFVPEGFGTGDAIVVNEPVMDFFDLKYGKGVKVDAQWNKQLLLYALGALNDLGHVFDIKEINVHIFQPRLNNTSTFTISVPDLLEWAEYELKPKAALAFAGEGEFSPGEHCRFCRAKARCAALADYNLKMAQLDFKAPDLLTDEEITEILKKIPMFEIWVKAINDFAFSQALQGKKWPGFKLVEGRSNRKYSDEGTVEKALVAEGFEDIYAPKKLVGITELEKKIGKKIFQEIVVPYLIKPPGSPTLVSDADKRPEYASADSAADDFSSINMDEQ